MTTATRQWLASILAGVPGPPGPEPADALAAADHHGVTALVWQALRAHGGADRLVARLAPPVRAAVAREVFVRREVHDVLAALARGGVRALVIKGTALAYTTYREPWLRPRTDTDLLVPPSDVSAAGAVLAAAGYLRTDALTSGVLVSQQLAYERVDPHGVRHVLDLHWKLVNPLLLADALPFEWLWQRAVATPALGSAAAAPSAACAVLIGCIHRLAHHQGDERLVWLHDLHALTCRFTPGEWEAVAAAACERGVAAICFDGLRESARAFGTGVPAPVLAALGSAARSEPSRLFVDRRVHRRDVLLSDLAMLPAWRDRLRLLREHAFPPATFLRQRYGVRSAWWLPALYVHRLVAGAAKWVRP